MAGHRRQLHFELPQFEFGGMEVEVEGRARVAFLADLQIHQFLAGSRCRQGDQLPRQPERGMSVVAVYGGDPLQRLLARQAQKAAVIGHGAPAAVQRIPLEGAMQQH